MTTKTEHKYAQVFRWIADGGHVECRAHPKHEWEDWPKDFCSKQIVNVVSGIGAFEFRLKPRTITVNGREINAPEIDRPKDGVVYWIPSMFTEYFATGNHWNGSINELLWLRRGLVHLTKENAIAHAKAMLGID